MKKIELGQAIGIVANLGVVASLVFVGMQMRQSQSIALSDMYSQIVANQIAADDAIAAHADIWVRGNAGEELEPNESAIFSGQVRNLADIAYFTIQIDLEMGLDDAADIDVVEFARYVYENPGAYRVWLEREEELAKDRAPLNSNQSYAEDWIDLVQSAIASFEDADAL